MVAFVPVKMREGIDMCITVRIVLGPDPPVNDAHGVPRAREDPESRAGFFLGAQIWVVAPLALGVHFWIGNDDLEVELPWDRAVPGFGGRDPVMPDGVAVEVVYFNYEGLVGSWSL